MICQVLLNGHKSLNLEVFGMGIDSGVPAGLLHVQLDLTPHPDTFTQSADIEKMVCQMALYQTCHSL